MPPLSEEVFFEFMAQEKTNREERVRETDRQRAELKSSVDGLITKVNDHEGRLQPLERAHKHVKRFGWAVVVGGIGVFWDAVQHHVNLKALWK